jgi:alpha-ketoglutarate-dependent sulfate ester dioxygenase
VKAASASAGCRFTSHYAIDNYDGLPKRLHRVTVAGDRPAGITGKQSYAVKGDASYYPPAVAIAAA